MSAVVPTFVLSILYSNVEFDNHKTLPLRDPLNRTYDSPWQEKMKSVSVIRG